MSSKIQEGRAFRNYLTAYGSTTQLHYAARNGNPYMAKLLLDTGSDVNEQDENGKTPLMLAVESFHESTIAVLLRYKPNVYLRNKSGKSAPRMAFELNLSSTTIVEMFLNVLEEECCNDVKKLVSRLLSVSCPLYHIVLLRNVEVTRAILEKGYDINSRHPGTLKTSFHVVLERRDFANAKLLIESGANMNARDFTQKIPLDYFKSFVDSNEEIEILQMIIDRFKLLTCMRDRLNFLRCVLEFGKVKAIRLFLKSDIDWRARDYFGENPLNYLIRNPFLLTNPDVVEDLRNKELDVNAQDNVYKISALQHATEYGLVKVVEMLLDKGADPNITNRATETPLMLVSYFARNIRKAEHKKIVTLLLQYGADIQLADYEGRTVFDRIISNGNLYLAEPIISQLAINETFGRPTILEIQDKIDGNIYVKRELKLCKLQLEELKKSVIHNSISLYELLNVSVKTIAVYARNKDFLRKLTGLQNFSSNSYYSDTLRRKIQKTVKLLELRKNTADFICEALGISYDSYHIIIDRIIDYIIG